jgi:hypothetical protein
MALAAQRPLQFAGAGLGQRPRGHQHHLVGRDPDHLDDPLGHRVAQRAEVVGAVGRDPGLGHDRERLPPPAVHRAEGDDVPGPDAVHLSHGPLHVLGEHVAAADDDHVLDPPAHHQLAVERVGQVAGP